MYRPPTNRAEAMRKITRFLRCMAAQVSGDKRVVEPPDGYCTVPGPLLTATLSATVAEAVAEEILQLGNGVDLLHRGFDVILDPAIANGVAIEQDVAGPPVAVARLADRADVAKRLALVEGVA